MSGFVHVKGREFVMGADERPFRFVGGNSYHLLACAREKGKKQDVCRLLDFYAAKGLSVVRTWAFGDAAEMSDDGKTPGRALDFVLDEAAKRGLRLLLVLSNYWDDCGGMTQYIAWTRGVTRDSNMQAEAFYLDPQCFDQFVSYIRSVLHRQNTLSGKIYMEDPTVFAWSVANEPRFMGDTSCKSLLNWLGAIGKIVKSMDTNHLLTFGSEGFFGPSTPELMHLNPYDTADHGVDFLGHSLIEWYDFCSFHLWPVNWGIDTCPRQIAFSLQWLEAHSRMTERLNKPVILGEFGMNKGNREAYLQAVMPRVTSLTLGMDYSGLRGSLIWHLATTALPDYDGNTIYVPDLDEDSKLTPDLSALVRAAEAVNDSNRC